MSFAYYRWFPGDYARDTGHLTMLQHGAYRQLLDTYMSTGKPIRGDLHALHRICGALSGEERQAVEFVLAEFFIQDGPVWRNSRCDRELNYLTTLSESGRNAAAMRWHSDRNAKGYANQNQNQNQNQKNLKPNPSARSANAPGELPPGFIRFWQAWPRHKRKTNRKDTLTRWKTQKCEPIADAIVAYVDELKRSDLWLEDGGKYILAPERFINERRWEDGPPLISTTKKRTVAL